jgi:large subunit ribosomal protein L7Ae
LNKYRPETTKAKKQRLAQIAAAKAKNETLDLKAPLSVIYGINAVVSAIESKTAKLVVIAHDVEPVEVQIDFCAFYLQFSSSFTFHLSAVN